MAKTLKLVATGVLLVALMAGLVTSVHAIAGVTGFVYWPDGTPVSGATVTVTNLDDSFSGTVLTNPDGSYSIFPCAADGDRLKVEATREGATATKTVTYFDGVRVDLTLSTAAPALTPVGLLALVGVLSAVVVLRVRRRRY